MENLKDEVLTGQLEEHSIYYRLCNIISQMKVAHLWVEQINPEKDPEVIQLKLMRMSDDVIVYGIDPANQEYLGTKVIAVNDIPVNEANDKLATLNSYETEAGCLAAIECPNPSVSYLRYTKILGENDTELKLLLQTRDNSEKTISISAVPKSQTITKCFLSDQFIDTDSLPLYDRMCVKYKDAAYSRYPNPEHGAMYFQYLTCANLNQNAFESFFTDMIHEMKEHDNEYDKFVIDLRFNRGGSRYLLQNCLRQNQEYLNKKQISLKLEFAWYIQR